ncbi:hypothetical protein HHK36_024362 [Tetracentron sinense]|uniref:Uncharacterized protein n=1 Tax=Tetracentron sinense TaxID=13715 RepID=A0A834YKV3_TETSI|nr:hypothetical protein HHK36_024362 [Tetracentron sinense]
MDFAVGEGYKPTNMATARDIDFPLSSQSLTITDLRKRGGEPLVVGRLHKYLKSSLGGNLIYTLQLEEECWRRISEYTTFLSLKYLRHELIYVQLREVTLQEENAAYEKAISNCEKKMQEKLHEADLLHNKLKEMDVTEKHLRAELEKTQAALEVSLCGESLVDSKTTQEAQADSEASEIAILEKLDNKKKELSLMEEIIQDLEKKWALVQHNSLRQPSPAQREKILDKQLHSLIEQLEAKQAQAEGLVGEIHLKEQDLEKLTGLWKRLHNGNMEMNTARNRFGKSISVKGSSSDYIVDGHSRPPYIGGRTESQQRLMLLRSAFVLYILALHVLVFIKISF